MFDAFDDDDDGWTPLHYASWNGPTKNLMLLLDEGANIEVIDCEGDTPLHIAIRRGRFNCVEVLLERGANRDIANCAGLRPIDLCTTIRNREIAEVIRKLLMSGGGHSTKAAKPRR